MSVEEVVCFLEAVHPVEVVLSLEVVPVVKVNHLVEVILSIP